MNQLKLNKKGNTLVAVLITSMIGVMSLLFLGKSLNSLFRSERGIAANSDLTEIDIFFRLVTETVDACATSGLPGQNLSALLLPSPVPVPLVLRYPANGGTGPVALQAGVVFGATRKIDAFTMLSLTPVGAPPTSNYIGKIRMVSSIQGKATSLRNPAKDYYINVSLDGGGNIANCSGGSNDPGVGVPVQCPAGRVMTGYNPVTGVPTCALPKYGGSFSWLGGDGRVHWGGPSGNTFVGPWIDPVPGACCCAAPPCDPGCIQWNGITGAGNNCTSPPNNVSRCWTANPVTGHCTCDTANGYVQHNEVHIDFIVDANLGLGGGFDCPSGSLCSYNVSTCYLP